MKKYVIGVDGGTESFRAGVFDIATGACAGFGTCANETRYPGAGGAEQRAEDWDNALVRAIQEAVARSGVPAEQISAVGVDGTTCTLAFLDGNGVPLRPAILWMDVRAAQEAAEVGALSDPALRYTGGGPVSAEWFLPKVLWIKRHEPRVFSRTRIILEETDWIAYRLTGEATLNINTITARWFYNSRTGGWPRSLYAAAGLDDVFDRIPSRIVRVGEVVGGLSREMASRTGLTAGIPVGGGASDAYMSLAGVNVVTPGKIALITGSSQLQMGLSEKPVSIPGLFGSFPDALIPDLEILEAGQVSTGSVLRWFVTQFAGTGVSREAERSGRSTYEAFDELAREIPPGSEGLVVLEHWQGNRTPWTDPKSRGVIRGLTLGHTAAHIYRAIMEAAAYGARIILDLMEKGGVSFEEIVACGGATKSAIWMQIISDVTGKPILVTEEPQAACLGSGIAAAVAAGSYPDLPTAAGRMVRTALTYSPVSERTEMYGEYVRQYAATYELLKDESSRLVDRLNA